MILSLEHDHTHTHSRPPSIFSHATHWMPQNNPNCFFFLACVAIEAKFCESAAICSVVSLSLFNSWRFCLTPAANATHACQLCLTVRPCHRWGGASNHLAKMCTIEVGMAHVVAPLPPRHSGRRRPPPLWRHRHPRHACHVFSPLQTATSSV